MAYKQNFDFDEIIDRHHTHSSRYDDLEKYNEKDLVPLTTADMNFRTAPCVLDAIKEITDKGIFGYPMVMPAYYDAVILWEKRKEFDLRKEWIKTAPGVINAFTYLMLNETEEGDEAVFLSPMYHPFARKLKSSGRKAVRSSFIYDDGEYRIDFDDLEAKLSSPKARLMILCNPHNPVGIVFTYEEIKKIFDLCLKYDVLLFSDEIHADIVYSESRFVSAGKVAADCGNEYLAHLAVAISGSKTFNIAGLQDAVIIIPDEEIRQRYDKYIHKIHVFNDNLLGIVATEAAFSKGGEWCDALVQYLEGNRDFIVKYIKENIPLLNVIVPEATYMAWIDCRKLNMTDEEIKNFFVHQCHLLFNSGSQFGDEGKGFVRMNFALPKSELERVLENMKHGLESIDRN